MNRLEAAEAALWEARERRDHFLLVGDQSGVERAEIEIDGAARELQVARIEAGLIDPPAALERASDAAGERHERRLLRFASVDLPGIQLQAVLDRVLDSFAGGARQPRRPLAPGQLRALRGLQISVREEGSGFDPSTVVIVVELSGVGDSALFEELWRDVIEPELTRVIGADVLKPDSGPADPA